LVCFGWLAVWLVVRLVLLVTPGSPVVSYPDNFLTLSLQKPGSGPESTSISSTTAAAAKEEKPAKPKVLPAAAQPSYSIISNTEISGPSDIMPVGPVTTSISQTQLILKLADLQLLKETSVRVKCPCESVVSWGPTEPWPWEGREPCVLTWRIFITGLQLKSLNLITKKTSPFDICNF